jgi:hypothetical protein
MKCCNGYMTMVGWGLRQIDRGFLTVDLFLCEKCRKTQISERPEKYWPAEIRPDFRYCRFILDRDYSNKELWSEPNDEYSKYAEEHGISRLHAIHELDGA